MRVCGFQDDPVELRRLYDTLLSLAVSSWDQVHLEATVKHLASRFFSRDQDSFAFPLDYLVAKLEEQALTRERLGVDARVARGGVTREQVFRDAKLHW